MKKSIVILGSTLMIMGSIFIVGCSSTSNNGSTSGTNNNTSSDNTNLPTFTASDLKQYDGQNGNKAYVAVNGKVYDVTNAKGWSNGKHQSGITAGQDLTSAIGKSPHGDSVLNNLPVVGTYK